MILEQLKMDDIERNQNILKKEHFSYKIDKLYRDYQELYFKSIFKNHSFEFKNGNKILVPITFDSIKKNFSFFGDPIEFFCTHKMEKFSYEKLKKKIDEFKDIKLFKLEIDNEKILLNKKFNFVEKVINEIYIDLSLSEEKIKENFSSNHRNEISKSYPNTSFELIDYKNYKPGMIYEMMKLHKFVAGRQTRSKDSWKQNENMILKNKGFLTRVKYNEKIISYSFFYHNQFTCIYLSSVGIREYYKVVRNIHHKSLWLAINYARSYCKYFYIGPITLFSKTPISEKEITIERFKKKFKGINKKFVIINKLPDYEVFNELIKRNNV